MAWPPFYGIVKRHGGWIEVASEVGLGTTFAIFFPACTEPVEAKGPDKALAPETRGGKETILVVEDEPVLREMAHVIRRIAGIHAEARPSEKTKDGQGRRDDQRAAANERGPDDRLPHPRPRANVSRRSACRLRGYSHPRAHRLILVPGHFHLS